MGKEQKFDEPCMSMCIATLGEDNKIPTNSELICAHVTQVLFMLKLTFKGLLRIQEDIY